LGCGSNDIYFLSLELRFFLLLSVPSVSIRVVTYHIRVVLIERLNHIWGVYSRAITYCAVRNRNSDLGCFILEAARLLVYLAQFRVVPRNVLKKATWSWLTPVIWFGTVLLNTKTTEIVKAKMGVLGFPYGGELNDLVFTDL